MLDFILEQLLSPLAAPLFAAVSKSKSKTVKKAAKKNRPAVASRKRVSPKKAVQGPAPKATRGATKKTEKPARDKKSASRNPAEPGASVRKSVETESAPKPIPPGGRAILLSPENEKFSDTLHPTFRWLSVGSATRYEVAWSEQPDLTQSHSIVSIATEAAVPVEKPLHLGMTYYWRVRGGNEGGWGPWSPTISFRVLDEAA